LRAAIASAAQSDTIVFASNMTISVSSTLTISQNLTIGSTVHSVAVDGGNSVGVFQIKSGAIVYMINLTVQNGHYYGYPGFQGGGGGIENEGGVVLFNSTVAGNHSTAALGAGIFNSTQGTVSLINSTVSGNTVAAINANNGGGIENQGTLTAINSTISNNTASLVGGGIHNAGSMVLTNTTVSGNYAAAGLGLFTNQGSAQLANTIVADGCYGTFGDAGGNLDSGTTCGFTAPSSKSNAVLNLLPLANNGGPTQTVMPGPGSMAIDAGLDWVCTSAPGNMVDQRGIPRPQGAHCDSGAVEVAIAAPPVAAQTLDRWAMMLLGCLLGGAGVLRRLRRVNCGI